jgi:hypothetical protein
VSNKFCFSDVPSSSLGVMMNATGEHAARVIKFASLGNSSPNTLRAFIYGENSYDECADVLSSYNWLVFVLGLLLFVV